MTTTTTTAPQSLLARIESVPTSVPTEEGRSVGRTYFLVSVTDCTKWGRKRPARSPYKLCAHVIGAARATWPLFAGGAVASFCPWNCLGRLRQPDSSELQASKGG